MVTRTNGPSATFACEAPCTPTCGAARPSISRGRTPSSCIRPTAGGDSVRRTRRICERKLRYGLVVSVETDDVSVDLYTAIKTVLEVPTVVTTTR